MPVARFLREYWQKRPLLVRGALSGFEDPLTPEELAGLACEDGVESRIVRERGGTRPWEVTWGPQDESMFARLPEQGWTILVQELNRHVPEAARLLEWFSFLPNVRVDDVMVSYAVPGGSVGAHLDSYDVFLIQGMGQRRWRYGTKPAVSARDTRFVADLDLRILERFRPDADEVLCRGDMLYLPPRFAHHGIAETACLTYSVGFRSPGYGEMWNAFGAHLARSVEGSALLVDPPLVPAENPGGIPAKLLAEVRRAIRAMDTSDEAIDRWFASFATRLKPGHELVAPRRKVSEDALFARLERGARVVRSEEGKWAYLPRVRGELLLYVAGEEIAVSKAGVRLALALCASRRFDGAVLANLCVDRASRALLARLFADGALGFESRQRY